jgi:hypothetical protein
VNDALMGGKSLRDFLAYFLKISVQIVHDGSAKHHPVITTNVLKNIIGDDVDHPSEILLNSAVTTITGMAKRDDDERILNQASSEGFGETAFISDLWNLFEIGDIEAIDLEAAKIHLASDKSPAVLESLAEYALTNIPEFGSITYHILRAFAFQNDPKGSWPFVRCLLNEMKKVPSLEMHEGIDLHPRDSINYVISEFNPARWLDFTSVFRIWTSEYVRTKNYHREISYWLDNACGVKPLAVLDNKASPDLVEFFDDGNTYFIPIAEKLIENEKRLEKIPFLEALRVLAKRIQKKHLPLVQKRIEHLIAS